MDLGLNLKLLFQVFILDVYQYHQLSQILSENSWTTKHKLFKQLETHLKWMHLNAFYPALCIIIQY